MHPLNKQIGRCRKGIRRLVSLAAMTGLICLATLAAIAPGTAKADVLSGRYILPPAGLNTEFSVRVLGTKPVKGRFASVRGEMVLDAKRPAASHVKVTVDMTSVETWSARVTDFLKSAAMFNVSQYPTALFESYSVRLVGKHSAQVEGYLTLRGARQRATMEVRLEDPGNGSSVAIEAEGYFFRSRHGMDAGLPIYGDKVRVKIEGTVNRL